MPTVKQWKRRELEIGARFVDPETNQKVGRLPSNGHAQSDLRIPAMQAPAHPPVEVTHLTRAMIPANVAAAIRQSAVNTVPGNLTVIVISKTKKVGGPVRRLALMSVPDFRTLVGVTDYRERRGPHAFVPAGQAEKHPPIDVESKAWTELPPKLVADLDALTLTATPGNIPVAVITSIRENVVFALMDFEDFVALAGGASKRKEAPLFAEAAQEEENDG